MKDLHLEFRKSYTLKQDIANELAKRAKRKKS